MSSSSSSSTTAGTSPDVLAYEPAPAAAANVNRLLLLCGAADALCVPGQVAAVVMRDATFLGRIGIIGTGVFALYMFALIVCLAAIAGRLSIRTARNCLGGFVVTLLVLETFSHILGAGATRREWFLWVTWALGIAQPLVWPVVLVIALRPEDRRNDTSKILLVAGVVVSLIDLLRGVGLLIFLAIYPPQSAPILSVLDVCCGLLATALYVLALRRPAWRRACAIGACALLVGVMLLDEATQLNSALSTAKMDLNWIWAAALVWLSRFLWIAHVYFVPIVLVAFTHKFHDSARHVTRVRAKERPD
jgi:hypothetical protein